MGAVDKSAQGRSNRRKGAGFERDVAAHYRAAGFPEAKRGSQSRMGHDAPDVTDTPWWVECKVSKNCPNVHKAYEQGMADSDGREVVVWSKQTHGVTLVTMAAEAYLEILNERK